MGADWPSSVGIETDPVAEADIAAHVAAGDPHAQYQKESEKAQADGYASLDGAGQVPLAQLDNAAAPDLSAYATDADLAAHEADTTSVHGITDTANLALTSDARFSDARTPLAHSHPTSDVAGLDTALTGKVGTGDSRLSDARTPTGAAGGVLSGTYPNPGLAADMATQAELNAVAAAAQPLDSDLTDIAALAPSNDTVVQRKSGVWVARSMAEIKTDLALAASDVGLGNVTNDAQVAKSLVDAKGDLLVGTADNTVARKAVGANLKILRADSAQSDGMLWDVETVDERGPGPSDIGLLAWNFDPMFGGTSYIPNVGFIFHMRVPLVKRSAVTKAHFYVFTAAVSPTAGQSFVGVYSSAGTLLGKAGLDTVLLSTGFKAVTLTAEAGQSLPTGGPGVWVHVAFMQNAGTGALLIKYLTQGIPMDGANAASAARFVRSNAGSKTSLPGTALTETVDLAHQIWVGLS